MTMLHEHEPNTALPEVPLSELAPETKDFLIAHSAMGKPVAAVIREVLNAAAERAGFLPAAAEAK